MLEIREPQSMLESIQSIDKGVATLVAACIAALVSTIGLFISYSLSRGQEKLKDRLELKRSIDKESREFKLKQLTEFYDPIYTLLSANKDVFERIGPTSEARRSGQFNDEETAEVWQKLSTEVIVPNNLKVSEIIQKRLHLLADSDCEAVYLEFVTHAQAYKVFKENAYEAYKLFPYPSAVFDAVVAKRRNIKKDIFKTYELKIGWFKRCLSSTRS